MILLLSKISSPYSFCALNLISSDFFCKAASSDSFWNISASALTSIFRAAARLSRFAIFIFKKSSWVPASLDISFIKSSVLPIKAYSLAFSKLRSLPSNNSASNSDAIEDSKSNKPLAMPWVWSKVIPNNFAWNTADTNSEVLPPKLALKFPEIFAAVSISLFKSPTKPDCAYSEVTPPVNSSTYFCTGTPNLSASMNSWLVASAERPHCLFSLEAYATLLLVSSPKSVIRFNWRPNEELISSSVFIYWACEIVSLFWDFSIELKLATWSIIAPLVALAASRPINRLLENLADIAEASNIALIRFSIISLTVNSIPIGPKAFFKIGPKALKPADRPAAPADWVLAVLAAVLRILLADEPAFFPVKSLRLYCLSLSLVRPFPVFKSTAGSLLSLFILSWISPFLALFITVSLEALAAASKGPEICRSPGISLLTSESAENQVVFLSIEAASFANFPYSFAKPWALSLPSAKYLAWSLSIPAVLSDEVAALLYNSSIWMFKVLTIPNCLVCSEIACDVALEDLAACWIFTNLSAPDVIPLNSELTFAVDLPSLENSLLSCLV